MQHEKGGISRACRTCMPFRPPFLPKKRPSSQLYRKPDNPTLYSQRRLHDVDRSATHIMKWTLPYHEHCTAEPPSHQQEQVKTRSVHNRVARIWKRKIKNTCMCCHVNPSPRQKLINLRGSVILRTPGFRSYDHGHHNKTHTITRLPNGERWKSFGEWNVVVELQTKQSGRPSASGASREYACMNIYENMRYLVCMQSSCSSSAIGVSARSYIRNPTTKAKKINIYL